MENKKIEEEMLNNYKQEMHIEEDICEDCDCEDCSCEDCDCDCDCDDCCCEDCDCDCEDCCCDCEDNDCDYFDILMDRCSRDFAPEIKSRGEKYYEDGKVGKVIKDCRSYKTKVYGSDVYDVELIYNGFDFDYICTCPCDYPCKHIYATLLKIHDGDYQEVELKEEIDRIELSEKELLEKIPAEELKSYLLSDRSDDAVDFCLLRLYHEFEKYLPVQTYEYYYNNIYNSYILEDSLMIYKYINAIKEHIAKSKYEESFKVIKAMIEANYEALKYVPSALTDFYPNLAMFMRVTLRKCSDTLKEEIIAWFKELEEKKYYSDVYLEDFILDLQK